MVNKFEAFGVAISIGLMVLALWIMRIKDIDEQFATLNSDNQSATVAVADDATKRTAVESAVIQASNKAGNLEKLIIDDIVVGDGDAVEIGDTVSVHYIGTLQNGQEFDNSYMKGAPFEFEVGKGRVIEGWHEGLIGMKEGGQRILVIPYAKAYGEEGFGPIPGRANLVFAIELVSINQ